VNNFTYFGKKIKEMKINSLVLSLLIALPIFAALAEITEPDIHLKTIVKSYSDKQSFANPAGIFLDPLKQEVYLADAGNHQIGIFDIKGTTLWTFKHWVTDSHTGQRALGDPHSIVVNKNGEIIVSDNKANYIDIFDYRGSILMKISPADYDSMPPFRGAILALDHDGNLYIGTKVDKSEIIKLNQNFELSLRFGKKGDDSTDFRDISGIWVDVDGSILVTDSFSEPALKKFNSVGEYTGGFGGHTVEKNDFSLPSGVVATAGGRIWISDTIRQVVKCLTPDGQYITMIGGLGNAPGDMAYPCGVTSDGDSLLIVAEKNGNRFQQFIIK
jgi:DNA-binding beta-propeller fold protein YncE